MVRLSLFEHRGNMQIKISFPFDEKVKELISHIPGTRWSQTKKTWYIRANKKNLESILSNLQIHVPVDDSKMTQLKSEPIPVYQLKKIGKGRVNAKVIDLSKLENLISHIQDKQEKILLLSLMVVGLNVKEIQMIKIDDIDQQESSITIKQNGTGKTRKVFIPPLLLQCIFESEHIVDSAPYIFGKGKGPYSEQEIKTIFRLAQRRIKISKPASPLIMKRSFVEFMKKSTNKTSLVAKLITYRTHPVQFSPEEVQLIQRSFEGFYPIIETYLAEKEDVQN
jgi:integrase